MATKQAERVRSKEKERLDACMAPGGIHGLEQQQRDLGKCQTSEERRRAMRAWFTWLPFAEFLYNSRAARQRAHDRSIRWRRYLQQIEFGVTRDLVQALQRADAENKQYLDHSRPMAPQGRERRCQHCLLLLCPLLTLCHGRKEWVRKHWKGAPLRPQPVHIAFDAEYPKRRQQPEWLCLHEDRAPAAALHCVQGPP